MKTAVIVFPASNCDRDAAVSDSRFTKAYNGTTDVTFPIAHHDGNYFADDETLNRLEKSGRVIVKYDGNPNGSARDIAGICNEAGNVMGMMPHPERAVDALHGGTNF